MALRDELAQGVGEGERVLGVGVNGEGREVHGLGGGFSVDFSERNVENCAVRLAQVVVRAVGGDADDRVAGFLGTALKGAADGVQAGKKVLTNVSLTTAAPGQLSSKRKSRPETRGIFIVESHPGEMGRTHRESD